MPRHIAPFIIEVQTNSFEEELSHTEMAEIAKCIYSECHRILRRHELDKIFRVEASWGQGCVVEHLMLFVQNSDAQLALAATAGYKLVKEYKSLRGGVLLIRNDLAKFTTSICGKSVKIIRAVIKERVAKSLPNILELQDPVGFDNKDSLAQKDCCLDESTRTASGTNIVQGIEYNIYPAPPYLFKAMNSEWAKKLIYDGIIRLNSLSYYQNLENEELGDVLEGLGEYCVDAHVFSASALNQHFIWCSSVPNKDCLELLKLDDTYNVVIKIINVVELVNRIQIALKEKKYVFSLPQIGPVDYSRSTEIPIETLQNQKWQWSSFQKDKSYSHQEEYRVVFTDVSFQLKEGEPIDLVLGDCSDILQLVETKS